MEECGKRGGTKEGMENQYARSRGGNAVEREPEYGSTHKGGGAVGVEIELKQMEEDGNSRWEN